MNYDWVKIVDFLIKAYFWVSTHLPIPVCSSLQGSLLGSLPVLFQVWFWSLPSNLSLDLKKGEQELGVLRNSDHIG